MTYSKEKIEQLNKEINELHKKLDKIGKKIEDVKAEEWKPKINEYYYYASIIMDVAQIQFDDDETDRNVLKYNKIFKTKKEAQEYADYLKAIKEKTYKFSKEEWEDNNIAKWGIYYEHKGSRFNTCAHYTLNKFYKFIFKTKEEAQAFIDEYGDKILKYEF